MSAGSDKLHFSPFHRENFIRPSRLVDGGTNLPIQFRTLIGYARTQSYHVISQNEIRLICLEAIKNLVQALTVPLVVHTLFRRSVHLFEDISCNGITPAIRSTGSKITPAAITTPILYGNQFVHAFACSHTRGSGDIPTAHNPEILIAAAREQRHSIRRIEIVGISKTGGTLQSVTTDRGHINRDMIVGGLLYQVVVVEEPTGTGIDARSILLHHDAILLHLLLQLQQFPLLFGGERVHPVADKVIQHSGIRDGKLCGIIYIRATVQARKAISLIIIPGTTTQEIKKCLHIIPAQILGPGRAFQHIQHFKCIGSPVNGITPNQALLSMSPTCSVGSESLSPKSIGIRSLGGHTDTALANFRQQVYHRNGTVHGGHGQ